MAQEFFASSLHGSDTEEVKIGKPKKWRLKFKVKSYKPNKEWLNKKIKAFELKHQVKILSWNINQNHDIFLFDGHKWIKAILNHK